MGPVAGETLAVYRGETDRYGNANKTKVGDVEGVFAWARWGPGSTSKADSASTTVELYVERGTDLRFRDRVERANGQQYAVVGREAWDQAFPFDGYDFGYMVFQLEAMNA